MDGHFDMASFNHYYRNKLKRSLTYNICHGYFKNIRAILDTDPHNQFIDVNETDEWWVDNEAYRRKTATTNIGTVSTLESTLPIILPLVRNTSKTGRLSPNEQANLDYRKRIGRTSLMLCSLIEDDVWAFSVAQTLLERPGASLVQKDSNGHNAIHYAVMYERMNLLQLYLSIVGDYSLLSKDRFGNTVFHLASLGKNEAICELLHKTFLKYKNNPNDKLVKNKKNHTAFLLCRYNGHENCMNNLYLNLNLKLSKETPESAYYTKPFILNQVHFQESLAPLSSSRNNKELIPDHQSSAILNDELPSKEPPLSDSSISKSDTITRDSNYLSNASLMPQIRADSPECYYLPNELSNYNLEKNYRFLYVLIEPLIKHSNFYVQESFSEVNDPNRMSITGKRPNYRNVEIYRKNLSNYKKLIAVKSFKSADYLGSKLCEVFNGMEVVKTKSFRPHNTNISSNLFEKVSSGILQGKDLLSKQKSNLSDKSSGRRQSVGSSSRITKQSYAPSQAVSQAQSRRTSVIT